MKHSLIFLRSFGDFVIALCVLSKSKNLSSYRFIASVHLEPLYEALLKKFPDLVTVEFRDFHISHKIFGAFTNKFFLHHNNVKEIYALKKIVHALYQEGNVFVEQERRRWFTSLFLKKHFAVHQKGNVYDSYLTHFNIEPNGLYYEHDQNNIKKVIIFPESRKPSKAFSPEFVHQLIQELQAKDNLVELAFFKSQPYDASVPVRLHHSFEDLLNLIEEADEIVTADSLPAHLAQMFSKPHVVYYNRTVDFEWITPYCKNSKAYGVKA